MAKHCEICGKGQMSGNYVSFSHKKTKRTWKPNLKDVKVNVDGTVKKISICSKCLKAGKVERVY
ncbi:50S ribosomal protein L28 [Clostridiaceae bacterium HSG29]|nr:50S ribosomal protein L28 [Clostridiaceae bacterium HSG29]